MSAGDATTLPLPDAALGEASPSGTRRRVRTLAATDSRVLLAVAALVAIVLLSAFLVVIAADRPSVIAPTSHNNFFPRWMAGPLGGLWPGLTRSTTSLRYYFTGALVIMYLAYVALLSWAPRLRARWVLASIALVHLIYLLAPPMALTDVFNYVNYGRMQVVHNLNPYTTIPILEPHSDPSFALSNWHQLLSPYGPLFTLLTFAVVPLGVAASFWALKAIIMLASLATLTLVWRAAKLLGRDPLVAVVLVGLNPIVLAWGLGGDHNDFLMLLFIVLAFYLLLLARSRAALPAAAARMAVHAPQFLAGAAFVTAIAIKASSAVLVPVVLASLLRSPRELARVLAGMLAAGVVLGAASLIAFGVHLPDLNTQSSLVTNESIPNLIGLAVGAGGETETLRALLTAALGLWIAGCCWLAFKRRDAITASGWASIALLVALSWVLPWYVLWALPLAALSSSRALRRATLVLGAYLIIAWAPASWLLWNAIGFHPERTKLGRLHAREVTERLN